MTERSPSLAHLAKQFAASGRGSKARPAGENSLDSAAPEDQCGDFGMRIARDGTWFYHGSPIGRKRLVKLFATVLSRDDEGVYWLATPVERGRIEVEDAPFVAVRLSVTGRGRDQVLTMETNLDDIVAVDAQHPIRVEHDPETGEPSPYVLVRDRLEARINRAVYYELVDLGVEHAVGNDHLYGVWSSGIFFPLGRLTEPT